MSAIELDPWGVCLVLLLIALLELVAPRIARRERRSGGREWRG